MFHVPLKLRLSLAASLALLATLPAVFGDTEGPYTYTVADGKATITSFAQWYVGDLMIADTLGGCPVTSIGDHAFSGCSGLTSVTIPSSVTSIGNPAFSHCFGLIAITVGADNPAYSGLGGVLFNKSQTLLIEFPGGLGGNYTIPSSVTSIGQYAFIGCSGLTSVTFDSPSSVSSIGVGAFQSCTGLTSVRIPFSVASIGQDAFFYCIGLTSVTFASPSSVTSIGGWAFDYCHSLTSVTIPPRVTSIGDDVFNHCSGLTATNVEADNSAYSSLGGVLFNKPQTLLVRFPGGLGGSYAIPSTVTSIGDSALSWCEGLTHLNIPSSVAGIGDYAFVGCSGLTSVTIPSSVASIGDRAFSDCSGLTAIMVEADNPSYSSLGGVLFNKPQMLLIQFPGGLGGSYTIPSTVTSIGNDAFYDLQRADQCDDILLGDWYRGLGVRLVRGPHQRDDPVFGDHHRGPGVPGLSSLTSVTIPPSVTGIGDYAFEDRDGLISVTFLGDAPTMGSWVFDFPVAAGFVVQYYNGQAGFTSPTWMGYPAVNLGDLPPIVGWLVANGFPPNMDILSDPNTDGVPLLVAYALGLDPSANLTGSMLRPTLTGNQLSLSFHGDREGITYTVQTTTDLQIWTTEGVTLTGPDPDGMRTATVEMDTPRRFLRLVVGQ